MKIPRPWTKTIFRMRQQEGGPLPARHSQPGARHAELRAGIARIRHDLAKISLGSFGGIMTNLWREGSVPEFIDPVFAKTSTKRSFSDIENERFGLVFAKTCSVNSGTGFCVRVYQIQTRRINFGLEEDYIWQKSLGILGGIMANWWQVGSGFWIKIPDPAEKH